MDVSIFGYKIGLEILILIGIIYLILVGHTICGCCSFYSQIEGFDVSGNILNCLKNNKDDMIMCRDASNNEVGKYMPFKEPFTGREGFTGANINYGESSVYNLNNKPIDTSSWSAQNMTIVPGQPVSAGVKAFMARPEQPIPLPEGELLMFANTEFKPECCPNTYSTSSGCACMTGPQYNYLISRGSNNVPYSEY